jgi:hypothetical protein
VQQDYLLRMIQELGSFVKGVLQLRRGGRNEQAIVQIQDAIGRFSGLSATLVHAISEDDLIQLLRSRGGVDPDRAWALAELLREEALAYDTLGNRAEATPRFLKSLRLYLEVLDSIEEMPDLLNVDGLEEVIEHVADLAMTPTTRRRVVGYLVDTHRYDRAENIVLWSIDDDAVTVEATEDAVGFYDGLLQIPAAELETGGLPREEVELGLANAEALLAQIKPTPPPL